MNFMIRTASVVALFTFWLAAIVWTVLIVAAPANAAPSNDGAVSTSTSAPAGAAGKSELSPADAAAAAAKSDHHMEVEKYAQSPEGQEKEKAQLRQEVA